MRKVKIIGIYAIEERSTEAKGLCEEIFSHSNDATIINFDRSIKTPQIRHSTWIYEYIETFLSEGPEALTVICDNISTTDELVLLLRFGASIIYLGTYRTGTSPLLGISGL